MLKAKILGHKFLMLFMGVSLVVSSNGVAFAARSALDLELIAPLYSEVIACAAPGPVTAQPGTGLLAGATKVGAFTSPTDITPTAVVLHWTVGEYDEPMELVETLRSRVDPPDFPNGRAVQLTVDKEGKVYQLSEKLETKPAQTFNDMSWNDATIGIEIESQNFGEGAPNSRYEDDLLNNDVQYQSVLGVVRELMALYGIENVVDKQTKKGIFGHYDIQPTNSDPGENYMAKLRGDLNSTSAATPVATTPGVTAVNTNLIPEAQEKLNAVLPTIEQLKPAYEKAAQESGLPWQVMATLHYRESTLAMVNPSNGEGVFGLTTYTNENGNFKPGPINNDQLAEQLTIAIDYFKSLAADVYGVTVGPDTGLEDYKNAFLAYNRGFMYKTAGLSADLSPYVMNYYDASKIDMTFPNSEAEPTSTRGKAHRNIGALTMMAGLGYTPGGGSSTSACGSLGGLGQGPDGFIFPLRTTKSTIDNSAVGWCKDNCHGTMWGGDVIYYAYDIGSPENTEVVAAKGGTVRRVGGSSVQRSIMIEGDDGFWYFYQHLHPDVDLVSPGDQVAAGITIGKVGPNAINAASNSNTPPHLHFSVSTEKLQGSARGCSRSACPNADTLVDVLPALLAGYQGLPE